MSLFAETNGFAEYADSAHKLLSDNRDLYVAMSAMTVNGRVPTADEVRSSFNPHRQSEAAAARGALADGDFLYGGGEMQPKRNGESDTERVRAQVAGKSTAASTQSPLKDEQPRRAASPIPGTYTHTPGA